MFECELPFDHKTLHLELEDKNFAGVMEGHQNEFKTTKSQEELVEESLANPYGSPSLEELRPYASRSLACDDAYSAASHPFRCARGSRAHFGCYGYASSVDA